jgi:hypothetical protein
LSKPYREIWCELNGESVYPVSRETKRDYQSISKARTFTPPSNDKEFVFAQLSKNLENACIKARRHGLSATRLVVFLRTQDFRDRGVEIKLSRATAYPSELFSPLREGFRRLFRAGALYRQTGVVLAGLGPEGRTQFTLFDDTARVEKLSRVYGAVDAMSRRYGKHTLMHAPSLPSKLQARHEGDRGDAPERTVRLLRGEDARRRLGLPMLRMKI